MITTANQESAASASIAEEPAIAIRDLSKRYGTVEALRGIDLTVPRGTLFGLLGPNGAGKSTLIKAIVGALRPNSGEVRTLGRDPLHDRVAVRQNLGYMPQTPALYADLSARDNITFFGAAHGRPDLAQGVDEILALTDLTERANSSVAHLSGGLQRRVSLAATLIHRPDLLILDEPTAAVDPALRARFWAQFRTLAAEGVTLFISTHLMDEALLCDRIAVLRQGQIIAIDTPQALLARGRTRVTLDFGDHCETREIDSHPADLATTLQHFGLDPAIQSVTIVADTLETVMLRLIQERRE